MAKTIAILVALALYFIAQAHARDPELLSDFAVPDNVDPDKLDGSYFTFTGLRGGVPVAASGVGRKTVSVRDFPALDGMGLSLELLEFQSGGVNVPHTHPRGAEILFVVDGSLTVGTTDTSGKLFKNVLQKGDVFIFPKGLPHYQANFDKNNKAIAVSAFGSANAGTVSLPKNLFGANIPDEVLTKAFKISAEVLQQLENSSQN